MTVDNDKNENNRSSVADDDNLDSMQAIGVNQRSAARLGAIQALYQMDLSGTDLEIILLEFENHRLGQIVEEFEYGAADIGFFRHLVKGVVKQQLELDAKVHGVLDPSWPLKRLDMTLRAILRGGAFEIFYKLDTPTEIILSEYIELAKAFFDDEERRLVHGVLNKLAQDRPSSSDESEPAAQ